MPLIPNIGSAGTALGLVHASSRDDAVISTQPFSQLDAFSDGDPRLEPRTLGSTNATVTMADHQRFVIRAVATSVSAVSLASALLAVYWFYMMRRNFRRDLVLLLILGGSWKSL